MKVLVVFAQLRRASFTGALLDRFVGGLLEADHVVEIADLYREGFNPCFREEDFAQFREGGMMPADALRDKARVEAADALGFVFPVWRWSFLAILKGWMIASVLKAGLMISDWRRLLVSFASEKPSCLAVAGPTIRLIAGLGTTARCSANSIPGS